MVKRLVFVAILALQLFAVTSVATADSPWPCCLPCSGDIGN